MKKIFLSLLVALTTTGATAQIAVSGTGNSRTFNMPAYDVEITTELWYKLDATKTLDENQTTYAGKTDFFLDRTLTAGAWNTFASPAAITDLSIFGTGAKVRKLKSSTLDSNGVLTITFEDATSIEAGKPYLVKPTADVVDPTLESVNITSAAPVNVTTDYADFIPTLGKTVVTGPTGHTAETQYVLILNTNDKLVHPTSLSASSFIKGFRGYFQLHEAAAAREFVLDFGDETITGIIGVTTNTDYTDNTDVYDLSGRRVQNPAKGIYIQNGKKVIIK